MMIYCLLRILSNHIWQRCWGILKYMYLIENSGFFAEDSNFSSAQESKIFWLNQKTAIQNSTRRRSGCHGRPFSQCPCSGLAEEETLSGVRTRGEQQAGRSQKCCKLWGTGGGICKLRELLQWGLTCDAVHLKKGKEFPHQSQLNQNISKKCKGDNIFMTAWRTAP